MVANYREAILEAARKSVQSHGYSGLNMRQLAEVVGIKAASIYYHFPSKADLGAAVARRYWEDAAARLDAMVDGGADPATCLRNYPLTFRHSLESENRMCLGTYMAAEFEDLPEAVRAEVLTFADINIAWLTKVLLAGGFVGEQGSAARARAIYAAVVGAQLVARSRADLPLYDELIESYRGAGLLPA